MAKQNIDIGAAANDGTGDHIRTAFDKCNDNFDELYTDVAALQAGTVTMDSIIRGESGVTFTGGSGAETISFASEFVTDYEIFINASGIGYEITNKDENGFDIEFLESGVTFSYVCIAITT